MDTLRLTSKDGFTATAKHTDDLINLYLGVAAEMFGVRPPLDFLDLHLIRGQKGALPDGEGPCFNHRNERYEITLNTELTNEGELAFQLGLEVPHVYVEPDFNSMDIETLTVAFMADFLEQLEKRAGAELLLSQHKGKLAELAEHNLRKRIEKLAPEVQALLGSGKHAECEKHYKATRNVFKDKMIYSCEARSLQCFGASLIRQRPTRCWSDVVGKGRSLSNVSWLQALTK